MRRVVSPIIDRVPTFVHRLYGRYPVRAVLAPMAPDFPDHDPEPTILDRFPIRCQARCKPCEKPCFQAVSGLNKVNECIDQPLIAPCHDLSGESPFAVRPVGQWHALAAGAVLDYFNDFMDGLCTGFYTDADGFWDYGTDLSMKSFMQAKLLRAMLRFKP